VYCSCSFGRKAWNKDSMVLVKGRRRWLNSYNAAIADLVVYVWAGPGPS